MESNLDCRSAQKREWGIREDNILQMNSMISSTDKHRISSHLYLLHSKMNINNDLYLHIYTILYLYMVEFLSYLIARINWGTS